MSIFLATAGAVDITRWLHARNLLWAPLTNNKSILTSTIDSFEATGTTARRLAF